MTAPTVSRLSGTTGGKFAPDAEVLIEVTGAWCSLNAELATRIEASTRLPGLEPARAMVLKSLLTRDVHADSMSRYLNDLIGVFELAIENGAAVCAVGD